jgi:hypothetical protein
MTAQRCTERMFLLGIDERRADAFPFASPKPQPALQCAFTRPS